MGGVGDGGVGDGGVGDGGGLGALFDDEVVEDAAGGVGDEPPLGVLGLLIPTSRSVNGLGIITADTPLKLPNKSSL